MPRRAYILVNESDAVICRVSTHNGKPNLSTYAEVAHVQNDLRHQYGRENQYTIYAIVPVTVRVMLEPLETMPEPQLDRGSALSTVDVERMTQIMRSTPAPASRSQDSSAPSPEPAPENLERQHQEDRPDPPDDIPF